MLNIIVEANVNGLFLATTKTVSQITKGLHY